MSTAAARTLSGCWLCHHREPSRGRPFVTGPARQPDANGRSNGTPSPETARGERRGRKEHHHGAGNPHRGAVERGEATQRDACHAEHRHQQQEPGARKSTPGPRRHVHLGAVSMTPTSQLARAMPAHRVPQHRRCETPELGGGECHLCLGARDGPCEVAGFHRPRGRLSGRFFYPFPYRRQDLGRAAQCLSSSPRRFREVAFIRQNRAQTVRDWQRRLAQRLCPSQRQCRPICRQNGAGRKTGLAPQFGRSWRRCPSALGWRRRRRRGAHRWACSCSGSSRAQHRRRFADRGGQRLEPGQGCTEPRSEVDAEVCRSPCGAVPCFSSARAGPATEGEEVVPGVTARAAATCPTAAPRTAAICRSMAAAEICTTSIGPAAAGEPRTSWGGAATTTCAAASAVGSGRGGEAPIGASDMITTGPSIADCSAMLNAR